MRLDRLLMEKGLAPSRSKASEWIREGYVRVSGSVVCKPAAEVDAEASIEIDDSLGRYVSRGALKLIDALDTWNIDVRGKQCVDLGASTGGFTQVLLERGADSVLAIDVGSDQLHPKLRQPRVYSLEHTNIRYLTAERLAATCPDVRLPLSWICCDLSFISLRHILPVISELTSAGATLIALIKPQFEVGPRYVGKGGIVRDDKARRKAIEDVTAMAVRAGFRLLAVKTSPIRGGDGNIEYLAHFERVEVVSE